jgi:hypothetical protein
MLLLEGHVLVKAYANEVQVFAMGNGKLATSHE